MIELIVRSRELILTPAEHRSSFSIALRRIESNRQLLRITFWPCNSNKCIFAEFIIFLVALLYIERRPD